jgi:hypothetical protein
LATRLSAIERLGYQGDRALVHLHLDALSDWPELLRSPSREFLLFLACDASALSA